jgi:cruciform cutting endonuclease 1
MATKTRPVSAKTLQALLTRIGSASSGTKDVLSARFERDVRRPHLFNARPDWKERLASIDPKHRTLNIMSIDMGIKNLAYCRAAVSYPDGDAMRPEMEVGTWERLNLIDVTRPLRPDAPSPSHSEEVEDLYSPAVLSEMAYRFLKDAALQSPPDIVLIESQRWRSGGGAAIQQWTIRVNTLEAMLWAILNALRAESLIHAPRTEYERKWRDYEVHGVSPKRVGQYWLGQHARALAESQEKEILAFDQEVKANEKKLSRGKAEKKAKIAILRSWLTIEPASTTPSTPRSSHQIALHFSEDAAISRRALGPPMPGLGRKKIAKATGDSGPGEQEVQPTNMKKLDDITDCLLQAAAWVAWETNRSQLYQVWDRKKGDDGSMPELNDEILREMAVVAGES